MNYLLGALSLLSALIVTSAAVSLFALYRAHRLLRQIERERQSPPPPPAGGAADAEMRQSLEALARQVHELRVAAPAFAGDPAAARPGLNLSKRSQALRMHRRGENAEQIAAALQVPRQEVDLLVKVHRIVLSSV